MYNVPKYSNQKTSDMTLDADFVKRFALNILDNQDAEVTIAVPITVASELAE